MVHVKKETLTRKIFLREGVPLSVYWVGHKTEKAEYRKRKNAFFTSVVLKEPLQNERQRMYFCYECITIQLRRLHSLKVPKCEILMSWIFMIFFIMKSI
jgi:hypothetical protein